MCSPLILIISFSTGVVDAVRFSGVFLDNPTTVETPSSAHRITLNDGNGSYFGEKYKVEKVCYLRHVILSASDGALVK